MKSEKWKLERQLAQKEHSIGMLNQHLTDKTIEIERLSEEIEEINREFVQSTHDWKEIVEEKEKEIEMLKNNYIGGMQNANEATKIFKEECRKEKQSKTEFAIQQLQRVKDFCDGSEGFDKQGKLSVRVECVNDCIDTIIKELKIEKD